jgi:hypothetical protein
MSTLIAVITVLAESEPYKSPEQWSYVIAGWVILIVGFAAYVTRLLLRGRKLSRQLPPDERRWMG